MNEPSDLATAGMIADALSSEDAQRSEYLAWLIRRGGTCRGCGATVGDAQLEKHPGVCASCFRTKKLTAITPPMPDPTQHQETPMPCSTCGGDGHNARSCTKMAKAKPIEVPVTRKAEASKPPAAPAKVSTLPARAKATSPSIAAKTTAELLDLRREIEVELKARLASAEAELTALRSAVGFDARAAS